MINENQLLHIWESQDEALKYDELLAGYKLVFSSNERFTETVGLLQSAHLVRSDLGDYSLTKKGWKVREKTPRPDFVREDLMQKDDCDHPKSRLEISIKRRVGDLSSDANTALTQEESPWHWFRRLVSYYIDCVRFDERPSNILYGDGKNNSFIHVNLSGYWWPTKVREKVTLTFPVRKSQNAFLRRVVMEEDFFIGYPFHLLGEDDKRVVIPVFCIPVVSVEYELDKLTLELDFENADVNSSWLEKRFRTGEEKRRFLQRCGLMDDENCPDEIGFDFMKAVNAVKILAERFVNDEINPLATEPAIDVATKEKGIYNSAVLFAGQKLRFNLGLISELGKIQKAPDEELDRSALKYVFTDSGSDSISSTALLNGDSEPSIPFVQYNYEQEQAITQALRNDLTVITGPPGTGKSQVVVNLLANLAVHGKTALFASKNHKAIDAVIPRTNDLVPSGTLISRLKNPDTGEIFTWEKAIKSVMAATGLPFDESATSLKSQICNTLRQREALFDAAELWSREEQKLSRLNEEIELLTRGLLPSQVKLACEATEIVPDPVIRRLVRMADSLPDLGGGFIAKIRRAWWKNIYRRKLLQSLKDIQPALSVYQLDLPAVTITHEFKEALASCADDLRKINEISILHKKIRQVEENTKEVKPLAGCTEDLEMLLGRVSAQAPELLEKSVSNRFAKLEDYDLRKLQQLSGIVSNLANGNIGPQAQINWTRFFHDSFSDLLEFFPMWAVSNLSVRKGVPLIAGIIDTVIIDEASQCDVASIIPLLFRARSAVIVGDPQQLKPVHRLSKGVSLKLLAKHQLAEQVENLSYEYCETSSFALAASSPRCGGKVQLKDHYRCHQDIAHYFNEQFYGKTLRVITNRSNLKVPSGYQPGVMWTNVEGSVSRTGSSGAICQAEIDSVVSEVKNLLVAQSFNGSIGVVTPFRKQADRITDAVYAALPVALLEKAEFVSSTADGFQGDERDVILLSTVYQPDMYDGGKWYITSVETRNLWNVAVSRARAALHVFGNKEACRTCGAAHLVALAERSEAPSEEFVHTGQFDSVWERKFFDALKHAGINTVSQYPLVGKRLDLAIPSLKIDIEVDGEKYHRDASGMRKAEDLWRDMTIKASGWTPIRFWVYELREDMGGCVQKVADIILEVSR